MLKISKPKLLILGIHSSLAPNLITKAKKSGFEIYGTTHHKRFTDITQTVGLSGIFDLQIDDLHTTKSQLDKIGAHKYKRIISLIGATSKNLDTNDEFSLSRYYQTLSLNLNLTHAEIFKFLELDGSFLYMSSRAAIYGSYDEHYAAVKASNTAFLLSLRRQCASTQSVIPVACSLIETSLMYERMSPNNQDLHRERTGNKLVQIEEVTEVLLRENLLDEKSNFKNGVYHLGRDFN